MLLEGHQACVRVCVCYKGFEDLTMVMSCPYLPPTKSWKTGGRRERHLMTPGR